MTSAVKRVAFFLGAAIFISYIGSIGGSFHFDDSHSVEANLAIRSLKNIPSFWTDAATSSFVPENRVYRPLIYTFYSFCWMLGRGNPGPFHLMKMVFHFFVCLALYLIWTRLWSLNGWWNFTSAKVKFPWLSKSTELTPSFAAFVLALLFAVHPACSECVDYISATTSLQCAMFYVWAFYAYLLFRENGKRSHLFLSLFLYFCSVASKEEGITLPAMVAFTEFYLLDGVWKDKFKKAFSSTLPYAVLGIVMAFWIYIMHPVEGNESRGWVTPFQYFITQWRAYLWYMRLWFWPWDLNADSASIVFSKDLSEPLVIQSAIGNILVLSLSWALRKKIPALFFGIVWFYVTISPASSVVVLAEAINEHRMYLSYIGFVGGTLSLLFFIGGSLFSQGQRELLVRWGIPVLLIGLFLGVQERNQVWSNDESLWLDTVEKNPTSGRALNNLALVYMARGEYEKSIEYFKKCQESWSTYMFCPLNIGIAYFALGDQAKGEGKTDLAQDYYKKTQASLERAYSLNPRNLHTNFFLGRWHEDFKNDLNKAAEYYSTAIDLTGGRYPEAQIRLAGCYQKLGKRNEAVEVLKKVLQLEPENQIALFEEGKILLEQGKYSESLSVYEGFLKLYPNHLQGLYNIGLAYLSLNNVKAAKSSFEQVLVQDSKSEQGLFQLALLTEKLWEQKLLEKNEAESYWKKLVEFYPQNTLYQSRFRAFGRKLASGGNDQNR